MYEHDERVELVQTTDPHTRLTPGIRGTVRGYSDRPTPTLRVAWDDGSTLAMLLAEGDIVSRVDNTPFQPRGDMTPAELFDTADRALSHATQLARGTDTYTLVEAVLSRARHCITPARRKLTAEEHTVSPRALLATTDGVNGERRITPDDVAFARTHGARLHVIEHADGTVTVTKQHRDDCPFITSVGIQDCDDECSFEHPAE